MIPETTAEANFHSILIIKYRYIKGKILKLFSSFPFEGEVYDYFINFEKKEFRVLNIIKIVELNISF